MAKYSKTEQAESLARLQELCPPGTTIYTIVRHVSRSGMSRNISLFVMVDGTPEPITFHAARVLGWPSVNRPEWALKVGGCGMDMCFHTVHSLSYAIHGHTTVGADAIKASNAGRPFTAKPGNFRAGYSLTARDL